MSLPAMGLMTTEGMTTGGITTGAPPPGKTAKAAEEFESVLLTSLFDSLQKSFAFDPKDETPGAADYRLMGTRAMAEAVAAGGGIGIAKLIVKHLDPSHVDPAHLNPAHLNPAHITPAHLPAAPATAPKEGDGG
ncbi:MAG: hypothetical protein WBQ72_14870 [Terriglobales bacterium]|jgi:Rod binding domain-containing protein